MNRAALVLFAKYPTPGQVKTRLIPALGPEGAAQVAESFLLDLVASLSAWSPPVPTSRILCFTPQEAEESFRALFVRENIPGAWMFQNQSQGDLGMRLAHALQTIQKECGGPIVFMGMDCLEIPLPAIDGAILGGQEGKAVIRPAQDGGYVMLGLPPRTRPEIFEDIRWSAPSTCAEQVLRARALEMAVEEQGISADVDEFEDLSALWGRIEGTPQRYPRSWKTLQSMRTRL